MTTNSSTVSKALTAIVAKRLEEKVCIITGGASGLGEAAAHLFAAHGAHVVIADVQDAKGQAVAAALPPPGLHHYIHCDVSQEADVAADVDLAILTFGRLDVMFNNAAIVTVAVPILGLDMETWDRVQAVNVRGVTLGMKHAARVMVPAGRGSIINTTSVAATLASEMGGCSYTASKHAVLGLTKAGAVELGKYGIRVNSVAPYTMLTPMAMEGARRLNLREEDMIAMLEPTTVLKGRFLQPEDVAQATLFLATDDAGYINGHNLAVDGGITVKRNDNILAMVEVEEDWCLKHIRSELDMLQFDLPQYYQFRLNGVKVIVR
ncbi:hypothetical protein O6H91_06G079700 [Diphasiastrum complanatum]|uniref:Uncharacterized protein n=2 Tax=Diphasiastrum complanatum TaxID=34168 RepID=A0ACC2DFN1_DIPCM|nr:hypothetical protein O6H91_06G079700 [Diphasiastrum complanatum]KAJ7552984.1 hypothetical protein O6H91_06G079700 [Diphasiastrum complanatum]